MASLFFIALTSEWIFTPILYTILKFRISYFKEYRLTYYRILNILKFYIVLKFKILYFKWYHFKYSGVLYVRFISVQNPIVVKWNNAKVQIGRQLEKHGHNQIVPFSTFSPTISKEFSKKFSYHSNTRKILQTSYVSLIFVGHLM